MCIDVESKSEILVIRALVVLRYCINIPLNTTPHWYFKEIKYYFKLTKIVR